MRQQRRTGREGRRSGRWCALQDSNLAKSGPFERREGGEGARNGALDKGGKTGEEAEEPPGDLGEITRRWVHLSAEVRRVILLLVRGEGVHP